MTVGSGSDGAQYLLKVTSNLRWVGDCPLKQKLRNGNSSAPGILEFRCKVSGFFACPNLGTASELASNSLSSQLPMSLHHIWKRNFKLDPYKLLALLVWPTTAITKLLPSQCLMPRSRQPLCFTGMLWVPHSSGHTQRHLSLASPEQPAMERQPDSLLERCDVPDSQRGFGTCHPSWRKEPPCRGGSTSDTASLAALVIPCSFYCCIPSLMESELPAA